MPTILDFEYRRLPYIFLVMNLPQVEYFNYLAIPRIEFQRNTDQIDAEIEDQQNHVGTETPEGAKIFLFPLQCFIDLSQIRTHLIWRKNKVNKNIYSYIFRKNGRYLFLLPLLKKTTSLNGLKLILFS